MKPHKAKVFVGLSGGVDSAVSAAILQKAGYDIIGVYIKVWQPDWISCTWKDERRDAMRVAAYLGIPFVTLDLVKEYKEGVIDYMISEYSLGRTPNPDVMCNREVKFGGFWKWAKAHGADFVATGHYAQNIKDVTTKKDSVKTLGGYSLLAGEDKNKDQSYFLWTLNQKDLEHILFPVGHLEKIDVRKLATKFGLPNALKKDSQGLCFIGKVDIKDFLKHYLNKNQKGYGHGDVLDVDGNIIGYHPGALFFTLGERHGFIITKKTTDDGRYYIIAKDMDKNTLTVANHDKKSVFSSKEVYLSYMNWTNQIPAVGTKVMIRSRYRQPLIEAFISKLGKRSTEQSRRNKHSSSSAVLTIEHTTDPITPGQSLVIYTATDDMNNALVHTDNDHQICLGGGIIS